MSRHFSRRGPHLTRVRRMKKLLLLLIVMAIAGIAARQLTSS